AARRDGQHPSQALAAAQGTVPHRAMDGGGRVLFRRQQLVHGLFHGSRLLRYVRHGVPSPAHSASPASLSRSASSSAASASSAAPAGPSTSTRMRASA